MVSHESRRRCMRLPAVVLSIAVAAGVAGWAQGQRTPQGSAPSPAPAPSQPSPPEATTAAVEKGARWLASVQGDDGGWGQDGGSNSFNRASERLESTGNDVANTAVAALALLQAG